MRGLMLLFIGLALPVSTNVTGCAETAPIATTTDRASARGLGHEGSQRQDSQQVTLYFDYVKLDDLTPFLMEQSGKTVTISPETRRYSLELFSTESMSRDEAFDRVMAKLRSDGLDIEETEDAIVINPGNFEEAWVPSWEPLGRPSLSGD